MGLGSAPRGDGQRPERAVEPRFPGRGPRGRHLACGVAAPATVSAEPGRLGDLRSPPSPAAAGAGQMRPGAFSPPQGLTRFLGSLLPLLRRL